MLNYGPLASSARHGTVQAMNYISEYKVEWVEGFEVISRFLETCLPDGLRIHHVGSTSVPGMPAKDIIDVDIECPLGAMAQVIAHLALAGFEHMGDQGIPTREAFRPRGGSAATLLRPHHLYACESGSPELRRHLAFRDYLLANPSRANWLAKEKRSADEAAASRDLYIQSKAASYEAIVLEAVRWAGG